VIRFISGYVTTSNIDAAPTKTLYQLKVSNTSWSREDSISMQKKKKKVKKKADISIEKRIQQARPKAEPQEKPALFESSAVRKREVCL
jgi:hypothetical protein